MPIEYSQLRHRPAALLGKACPKCGWVQTQDQPYRGLVQSWWRKLLRLPYCAVMCAYCKDITGWEKP